MRRVYTATTAIAHQRHNSGTKWLVLCYLNAQLRVRTSPLSAYILFGIPAAFGIFLIGMYNGLIGKKNQVANVYASLDAMLQKRYDLIPNLVSTVQGYMKHERELLLEIVQLRNAANTSARSRLQDEDKMSENLKQLFALAENYPQLKASQNFLHLQATLNEVEEQISAARRAFNASITDYNNAVEMFPSSVMAGMMGLQKKQWFEIADEQRKNVDISGQLSA
jgi:LemA protein